MKKGGIFVTGTDTGVGKTHVSCELLRQLNRAGIRAVGMKPVASGANAISGQLINDDVLALQDASAVRPDLQYLNPYVFEPAIAPHLAAARAGVEISIDTIMTAFQKLAAQADMVIVEGAGGWLVPLNASQTLADVARQLGLPVLLVVDIKLGCINHALLSARAIHDDGLQLLGWVANQTGEPVVESAEIITALEARLSAPRLGFPADAGDTHTGLPARIIDLLKRPGIA